jgi:hypothetical protein
VDQQGAIREQCHPETGSTGIDMCLTYVMVEHGFKSEQGTAENHFSMTLIGIKVHFDPSQ